MDSVENIGQATVDAIPTNIFNCTRAECGATFTREWRLKEHLAAHAGEKPQVCDVAECGRRFTRRSHLQRHKLTHGGIKQFRCTYVSCSQAFVTRDSLKRHIKYAHGIKDCYYKCPQQGCLKTFKKRKAYKTHLNEHAVTCSFQCQQAGCGRKFETCAARNAHEKTHRGYACKVPTCQTVAATWSKLQKHMLKHPATFCCSVCPKKFSKRGTLRRHRRCHTMPKPVLRCPKEGCQACFSTSFNLQHHIRKVHLQLLQYRCYYPDCTKAFAMSESLARHVVHHDPDRQKLQLQVMCRRPSKIWQKRPRGGRGRRTPVIEEDLRQLFSLKLRLCRRGKVECDLRGLFNERKGLRRVQQEVSLKELFEQRPPRCSEKTPAAGGAERPTPGKNP
ncbi:LOW QUALITY PROTEIN: P43 5S RNA-binding protein-like [Polyodon spathula]|uniref:LOW QUALITY PROTEIN: P43 5S RNA-binding protein-like n=1 Tax=Polyodon spathula TaxID=7913 RepID=UPI001B7E1091|nr:LOW QUALITY PROTEIN: P43 5S RNA-binding protein-like [Polyodon spathula]